MLIPLNFANAADCVGSRGKKNSKRKKNPTKLKNAEEVVREDEVLKSQQYSLDEDAEDNSPDAPKVSSVHCSAYPANG